jgi:hypothetical protein
MNNWTATLTMFPNGLTCQLPLTMYWVLRKNCNGEVTEVHMRNNIG